MATYNLSVTNSRPASSSTQNVTSGDTVVITVTASGGGGSSFVSAVGTNCSVSPASDTSAPFVFTVTNFTSTTYSVQTTHVGATDTQSYSHTVSGSVSAGTPTAPTDIIFGNDPGTYDDEVSITATASGGTNGTMKVSADGSTWVANGSSFTFTRGTAKTIYARTEGSGSNSSNYSESHTVGYLSPDLSVSVSRSPSGDLAHDYTGDVTVTISGGTANNRYRVLRTTGGNSGKGNTGILTGTSGTVTLHNADANDLPSAGNTVNYVIQGRVDTAKGGNDTYANTNASFSITRDAAPVTGSFDLSTDTITEGGSLTVQNISTSPSGGYHLKLFRNSGDSPDSISPTTKTWTGTSTANFTMSVANQSASEIGYQGESFTWLLREGTDTSGGWNGGASLDSADFTLYDDEHGTSISDSTIDIAYGATSFTVGVVSNWSGTNTVAARIRNTSTDTVVKTFNITTNNGTTNVSVTSGLPAAAGGSSSNYRVEVYNGNAYLDGATFSVTRSAESVSAPTDIAFGTSSAASASVSITATASGGSGGTLQVSENNSTWVANGSSFTFTRGTPKTIYARRTGSGANSSSYSESHTVGYLTGDTSVSATSSTIAFTATSASTTVSGGQSAETYAVRLNNGSTNLGTRTGNGSISFSSSLPSGGNSTTYEIFVRRPTSTGGDGSTFTATNDTFTVTRNAADGSPNAFSFTDVTNVARSTTQTSNQITISGIDTSVAVSITGGTYSKNGGSYTSSAGTAVNGDTFTVRHTSSSSFSTAVNTTLNVGGTTDTFTSTTLAADTTPNSFSFTDVTGVALSSTQTSNQITISGLNTSTSVSITGGTYSKNGGSYTSSSGTAVNGDTFTVRHTSSSSNSTAVNTTLTVGGVSDTFTSTTVGIVAPTASSVTFDDPASANVTATVNLSDSGSDGTLEYACEVGDTTPDNWQSSNTFTIARGSSGTVYARARRSTSHVSNTVSAARPGFLSPDTDITNIQNQGFTNGAASNFTVTIENGSSNTVYQVRSGSNSGTIEGSRTGNGDITVSDFPSDDTTKTYYVTAYRTTATGGAGSGTTSAVQTFTVTTSAAAAGSSAGTAEGSDTYGIEVYGPDNSTVVWGTNNRQTNLVVFEIHTFSSGGSQSKAYTCADANDNTKVVVSVGVPNPTTGPLTQRAANGVSVSKTSSGFTVSVTDDITVRVLAARIA